MLARAYRSYVALEWQGHVVVVLAVLGMAYVQIVQPFFWNSGDPLDYYRIARYFLRLPGGALIPWRTPGLSLFLIVTGVAWLNTFKILIAVYAAMSVAVPVLIYVIVRRYSPTWGMIAALIAVLGAIPYAYSKVATTEELFHVLHFAVLTLIAAYFAKPENPRLPYAICLVMVALNLVRPVAALYYWIFLVCAIVLVRRSLKHVLVATAVYVGLMGGWALADRYYGSGAFPTVYPPETAAQRLFGEVYFSGGPYQFVPERPPVPAITAGDGPASRQMYDGLRWVVQAAPDLWEQPNAERPYLVFARYAGHPDTFVRAVASRPNFAYFDFLRHALQARYGAAGAERVMYGVAAEHGNAGLRGVGRYLLHNPAKLLVGGSPPLGGNNFLKGFYSVETRHERNYIYSLGVSASDLLGPDNGPASAEFFRAIHFFIRAYPGYWEGTNQWLSRYKHDPEGLFRKIFDYGDPMNGVYAGWYWEALNKLYGVGPADRLFYRVALETMNAYPHTIVLFWDNVLHIALIRPFGDLKQQDGSSSAFWHSMLVRTGDIVCDTRVNDPTGLTPGLVRELVPVMHCGEALNMVGYAYGTMHQWAPLFVLAALVLFPFCLLSPARPLAVFLAAAYVYNLAVDDVFADFSAPRYEDVFVLLPVMLACLGAYFAVAVLARRQTPERPPAPLPETHG